MRPPPWKTRYRTCVTLPLLVWLLCLRLMRRRGFGTDFSRYVTFLVQRDQKRRASLLRNK